jgi:hypothetical protein
MQSMNASTAAKTRIPIAWVNAVMVVVLLIAATSAGIMFTPANVVAGMTSTPVTATWVTDSDVYAIACYNGIVYIGGNFTKVGPVGGPMVTRKYIAAIDQATGKVTSWNPDSNGWVLTLAVHGSGNDARVVAGGSFTHIGGQNRQFIAFLYPSSGKADSYNPSPNDWVRALAVDGTGHLWAGGDFTVFGGFSSKHIALVGAGSIWAGNADGGVYALATSGNTVYVGGNFTHIQGAARNHVAAINSLNLTSWNPNASPGAVHAIAPSGSKVYVGGSFITIGGKSRSCIAALSSSTGQATSWNPNANNQVNAIVVSGSSVFAGGVFTSIGGKSRNYISELDSSKGYATAWNPNANERVNEMAASSSALYAGGHFTTMGGKSRPHFAQFALPKPATPTWYLAEGSTAWGFYDYIYIENPNETDLNARVTYMTDGGPVDGGIVTLPKQSQTFVNPVDVVGQKDFSTKVECLDKSKTIAVDRTMAWWYKGTKIAESHSSIGVTAPAKDWYLPEGSSAWGFECWLLIQNPNVKDVTCDVTYMIEGEGPKVVQHSVPANSRRTFSMADDIGAKDASIHVHCDYPVIPERSMYRNDRRMGHESIGTTQTSKKYYLAEGTSAYGFTTYVLIQNPNSAETSVNVTYMTDTGPVPHPENPIKMPANSRKTIRVNDFLPGRDFSTLVEGDKPIIAERAMYWDNGTGEAGHDSIGMAAPHKTFYLPNGGTNPDQDVQTYTLVQNPGTSDVKVRVTYLPKEGQGSPVSFTDTVPANSRKTYDMAKSNTGQNGASVMVECLTSGGKIMVERAMYWYNKGAGTDTIGGYAD